MLDWPYVEGLRMDEAMNPLTLVTTGLYGKPLPKQMGAPLRLEGVVPAIRHLAPLLTSHPETGTLEA